MKALPIVLVSFSCAMLVAGACCASEITDWTADELMQHIGEPNEHHHHEFRIGRDDDPAWGVGQDVTWYESDNELFRADLKWRWDITNQHHAIYPIVGKFNAWKWWKNR